MIQRHLVSKAFITLIADGTGRPCGAGEMPGDTPPPYYVAYSMPATFSGAPFSDLNEDASFVYQLTTVSGPDPQTPGSRGSLAQAEWWADKARTAFLGRDPATGLWLSELAAPGARCLCREVDTEPGAMNDPGDAIISYVIRFRFDLTAA